MRVVVAEDSVLFREGLVRLLAEEGHDVVAAVGDADALREAVLSTRPDIAVVDVRMPPGSGDDGARAAYELRAEVPGLPVLLLSQHVETRHVVGLLTGGASGYLLKDRVLDVAQFLEALRRVAAGGSALDPVIVSALLVPARSDDPVMALSEREHEVLALVAQGLSNAAIAARLVVAERTVEAHMRSIFQKLTLPDDPGAHRRVLAVLAYLTRQPS